MKKLLLLVALGLFSIVRAHAYEEISSTMYHIKVSNDGNEQREQVVELDAARIRKEMGLPLTVALRAKNNLGQDLQTQITYDGKLLVNVAVRPHSSTDVTILPGISQPQDPVVVRGDYYPERLDDIAWENDRVGFRVYGPALWAQGDRLFGIDVWCKRTPLPVLSQRYKDQIYGDAQAQSYKNVGMQAMADSISLATTYHIDHGNGFDSYAVGPTLGCGAPALVENGKLHFATCYKTFKILDNGPLRFTVQLTFPTSTFGEDSITELRIISLDRGSNYCRCEVWYEGLSRKSSLAMGVVLHPADNYEQLQMTSQSVLFADPTDRPTDIGSQIYVGVLLPNRTGKAIRFSETTPENTALVVPIAPAEHVVYYFGSAWSSYDVRSFREWKVRSEETLSMIEHPLSVFYNKNN